MKLISQTKVECLREVLLLKNAINAGIVLLDVNTETLHQNRQEISLGESGKCRNGIQISVSVSDVANVITAVRLVYIPVI